MAEDQIEEWPLHLMVKELMSNVGMPDILESST